MDKSDNMLELNNGAIVPAKKEWFRSNMTSFSYNDGTNINLTIHYDKIFKKYKFTYPKGMIIDIPFKDLRIKKYLSKRTICKIKRKQL